METALEKRCADCGEVKPTTQFSQKGIHPYCRPCANARSYAYAQGKGRQVHIEGSRRYYLKMKDDPEYKRKWPARSAVQYALRKGRLVKPESCERCGRSGVKLNGHHHKGYDKEHRLDVQWLCSSCHYWVDKEGG